jgi:uncharacterized protein YbjT (DUF2867 family)
MILVTGATGMVGREVVKLLADAGQKVRALTRDPAKAKFDKAVEVVAGDLDQPASLDKAAAGADAVFILATGPKLPVHTANAVAAAKKAGAKRLVKLSVLGAGQPSGGRAIIEWHDAAEKAITDSGIPWTFVRPGSFMSNALQWVGPIKGQGKVFSAFGDGKFAPVHPRDIAAVAAAALTGKGHEGQAYPLTGGEAMSVGEQVKILSEAIGKPIQYVVITDEASRDAMLKNGMPANLVDSLVKLGGFIRSGGANTVLPTVEKVLGRKPLTFAEWARENAAAFK